MSNCDKCKCEIDSEIGCGCTPASSGAVMAGVVGLDELTALRADKRRLDELEAIPFAIEIKVRMEFGKSDSAPSLRSQIDTFLEMVRKPNARPVRPAPAGTHEAVVGLSESQDTTGVTK